jgi:hypothetical protein
LLVLAAVKTTRPKPRVSALMGEDRDRAGYGKPGDAKGSFAGRTYRDRSLKFSAMRDRSKIALRVCASAKARLLRCNTKRYALTDARRIEHRTRRIKRCPFELLTAGTAGTIL